MHDAEEDEGDTAGAGGPPQWSTTEERWAAVELNIQMAIRRGEFDDLPGAGKPIENLGRTHDPDWWIRQKIERENLTGMAPPVFHCARRTRTSEPSSMRFLRKKTCVGTWRTSTRASVRRGCS